MKTHNAFILSLISLAFGLSVAASDVTVPNDLRIYGIFPDSFDYMFTSVISSHDTPMLSFNYRSEKTFFVHVGDTIGDYAVKSFKPRTERYFNPTISSYREEESGSAVLEGPDGKSIELELGKRFPLSGWMACLISLKTGVFQYARAGETAVFDGLRLKVENVSEDSVTVSLDKEIISVPFLTEEDRQTLADLRAEQLREQELKKQLAATKQKEGQSESSYLEVPAPLMWRPKPLTARPSESKMIIGTEYRYPVAYQGMLMGWDPSGRIQPVIMIPTRFNTRLVNEYPCWYYSPAPAYYYHHEPLHIGYSGSRIQIQGTFSF